MGTRANRPEAGQRGVGLLLGLAWLLLDKPGQAVHALDQGTPLLVSHVLFLPQQCVHEPSDGTPQQPMHPPNLHITPMSENNVYISQAHTIGARGTWGAGGRGGKGGGGS